MTYLQEVLNRREFQANFKREVTGKQVFDIIELIYPQIPSHETPQLLALMTTLEPAAVQEFETLTEFDDPRTILPEHVISLMIMNLMNLVDMSCESDQTLLTNPSNLPNFQTLEGYTVTQYIEHIQFMASILRVAHAPISSLESILQWQIYGMEQVKLSNQRGAIAYSMQDAISYRQNTLGAYFKTTANLGIRNIKYRKNFFRFLMEEQLDDDNADVFEDLRTQCNPFLAILQENHLIHLLVDEYQSFDGIMSNNQIPSQLSENAKSQAELVGQRYLTY